MKTDKMKKIIIFLLSWVLLTLLCYGMVSFIEWEIDVTEWPSTARGLLVITSLFTSGIAGVVSVVYTDKK